MIDDPMNDSDPTVLRSVSNPKVRHLLRMRDNRARRRAGRVLVDGWRETSRAIGGGLSLLAIYVPEVDTSEGTDPEIKAVIAAAGKDRLFRVSTRVMQKISYGQSARGVVAEFERPSLDLDDLALPPDPVLLVLDKIEKPGNVGAVFRCADAAGVSGVILCDCNCDVHNPNAIRSSLGTVFEVPTAAASYSVLTRFLGDRQIRPLAARVESSRSLWESPLSPPLAVVLGSEADGLRDRWQSLGGTAIDGVRIPMFGNVDSLNVSVSAALIAFEILRRQQHASD